jgi:indole-3-acetate monooxygenase
MPIIVKGVIRPNQIELDDTWHVSGLRATASNDATIDDLFIPDRDICARDHPGITPDDPAASVPPFNRFGPGVASVGIGVAQGCLDAFAAVAVDTVLLGGAEPLRLRPDVQAAVGLAMGCLDGARGHLRWAWNDVERSARPGAVASEEQQVAVRLSAVSAAEQAVRATDLLADVAGSAALYETSGIERRWRDAHAVRKHFAVSPRQYASIGQSALDVPARRPIL